jgi:hypothetical protein
VWCDGSGRWTSALWGHLANVGVAHSIAGTVYGGEVVRYGINQFGIAVYCIWYIRNMVRYLVR